MRSSQAHWLWQGDQPAEGMPSSAEGLGGCRPGAHGCACAAGGVRCAQGAQQQQAQAPLPAQRARRPHRERLSSCLHTPNAHSCTEHSGPYTRMWCYECAVISCQQRLYPASWPYRAHNRHYINLHSQFNWYIKRGILDCDCIQIAGPHVPECPWAAGRRTGSL